MELNPKREVQAVGPMSRNGRRREREVIRLETEKAIAGVMATCGCDQGAARKAVASEIRLLFNCDYKTASTVVERGYLVVDYHKKTRYLPQERTAFDHTAAYRMAGFVYKRKYEDRLPWYIAPEDLIQEGVLRLFEMAGHPRFKEKGFRFYLALNAMKGFIERQRRMRGGIGGTTPGYEETWRRDAGSDWQGAMAAA